MTKRLLIALTLLACSALHPYYSNEDGRWKMEAGGEGWAGGFRHGGGLFSWVPLMQDGSSVTYAQVLGGYFGDMWTGNIGVGYRRACSPCWGWGFNLFGDASRASAVFDERGSHSDYVYLQGGIGAELFGPCWEARINGYLPLHHQESFGLKETNAVGQLVGTDVFTCHDFHEELQQAYRGFDVEVGYNWCAGPGELSGYVGYYHYDARGVRSVHGPRLRAVYRAENFRGYEGVDLWAGVEWQCDRIHSSDTTLRLGFSIPLCGRRCTERCCISSICKRMGRRAERQPLIWVLTDLESEGCSVMEEAMLVFAMAGDPSPSGGTSEIPGTQANPFTLNEALLATGPGDVIILLNDNGPFSLDAPIHLEPQMRFGGFLDNSRLEVTLANGHTVRIDNLHNSGPAVLEGGASDIIQLESDNSCFNFITQGGNRAFLGPSSNTTISGVTVKGAASTAIEVVGGTNLSLTNVVVEGAGGSGLVINGVTDGRVSDSSFTHNGGEGIALLSNGGKFTFENNRVSENGDPAIAFLGGSANYTFNENLIDSPAGSTVINVAGGLNVGTFVGGQITNAQGFGITIDGTMGGSWAFDRVTLTDAVATPITYTRNAAPASFNRAILTGDREIAGPGILVENNSGSLTFTRSTLAIENQVAVDVYGGRGSLYLEGLTIASEGAPTALSVQNLKGGVASFGPTTVIAPKESGVRLKDNSASVSIRDFQMRVDHAITGFEIENQEGNVSVLGGALTQSVGGVAVGIQGGSGAYDLSGLTLSNSGSRVSPIQIEGMSGGSVAFGPVRLADPTAIGVLLRDNGASVSIGEFDMSVTDAITGFEIENQRGGVSVHGGTLSQPVGGVALNIRGGGAAHDFSGLTLSNTGSAVSPIQIEGMSSGSVALGSTTLTHPMASGVFLKDNGASVSIREFNMSVANAVTGFEIENQTGNVSVLGGLLSQPVGGVALGIQGGAASYRFGGLHIENANSSVSPIQIGGVSAGSVALGLTTLTHPTASGVSLKDNGASVSIGEFNMIAADSVTGFAIENQGGAVTVAKGRLDQLVGGTAIDIAGGSATYNFSGMEIVNALTTSPVLHIEGTSAGSAEMGPTTITDPSTTAVVLRDNGARVAFNDFNLTSANPETVFAIENQRGNVVARRSSLFQDIGGTAFQIQGGSAAYDLRGLSVENSNSSVSPLVMTGTSGGSALFGPISLTNPAATAVVLDRNSASLAFENLMLHANATITGFEIKEQTGNVSVGAGTFSQMVGGTTFDIEGGNADYDFGALSVVNAGSPHSQIKVSHTTGGSFTFGPTALTTTRSNPVEKAIVLESNAASFLFDRLDLHSAAPINGFDIRNQTGSVTVSAGSFTQHKGGAAFDILGGDALYDFSGLVVANTGSPVSPFRVRNTEGGSVIFGTSTLTNPAPTAIVLDTNLADFTFNELVLSSGAKITGFDINQQTGNVTVKAGSVCQLAGGTSIGIHAGDAVYDFRGLSVANTGAGDSPFMVGNTTGGSAAFGVVTITNPTAPGVALDTNLASFTFESLTLTSATAVTGFDIDDQVGDVTVFTGAICQLDGGTTFDIKGGSAHYDFRGLEVENMNSTISPFLVQETLGGSAAFGTLSLTDLVRVPAVTLSHNIAPLTVESLTVGSYAPFTGFAIRDQVGDVTIRSGSVTQLAGGTAFDIQRGSATYDFSGLEVINTGSAVSPIRASDADGTIGFGTIKLTHPRAAAIALKGGGAHYTFDNLSVSAGGGSTAFELEGLTGSLTAAGTLRQTLAGGTAFDIKGGSATYDFSKLTLASGRSRVSPFLVSHTTGGSITFGSATVNSPEVTAVVLDSNLADILFNSLTLTAREAVMVFDIADQGGDVTVRGGSITQLSGGTTFVLNRGSATCDFRGLEVSNAHSLSSPYIIANTEGGSLAFGPAHITDARDSALVLETNAAAISFDGVAIKSANASPKFTALEISDQTGDLTFTNSSITHTAGGRSLSITGGDANYALEGLTLTNSRSTATPIIVNDAEGSVRFGNVTLNGLETTGVSLTSGGADYTFGNLTVGMPNALITAIELEELTGSVQATGSITQPADDVGDAIEIKGGDATYDFSALTTLKSELSIFE